MKYLLHDTDIACPPTMRTAARFCAPGIVAHQSARNGEAMMEVPDFGLPPSDMAIMDLEFEFGKAVDLAHAAPAEMAPALG